MHSTWLGNEHNTDQNSKRIESASKKPHCNRIQVVSKISPNLDQTQHALNFQPSQTNMDFMNQTCVDRNSKLPMRRLNTVDAPVERDQRQRNMMKLMQEQLELAKSRYQQKIKQQLKQCSIQISKLKIKIQNNNELIANKDQQIQQLRSQLRRSSPQKQIQSPKIAQNPQTVAQKVNDIQSKYAVLLDNHNKISVKITEMNTKIQAIQKGLLSVLACKLANIQKKSNQYVQISSQKLSNIQTNLSNKLKKQSPNIKNGQNGINTQAMQSTLSKLDGLKQQVYMLKNKDFRYENSSIVNLRKDITNIANAVGQLQKRFSSAQNKLRNSKSSSRRNHSMNSANNSCYFQDYHEVYEQGDSIGQDQFFHPLQQSTRKYTSNNGNKQIYGSNPHSKNKNSTGIKNEVLPSQFGSSSKPATTHNDSFQNFTSDQQQEETPNQKRLINTLRAGGFNLPLLIQVDLTGYIRKKSDHNYLLDRQKRVFMLSAVQLNQCKNKGWIAW